MANYRGKGKSRNNRRRKNRNSDSQKKKYSEDRTKYRAEAEENESASNDSAWYTRFPEVLLPAARVPYTWPLGRRLGTNAGLPSAMGKNSLPGIMTFHYVPVFGDMGDTEWDLNAPINQAARDQWAGMRSANAGAKLWDAPDGMIYELAYDSIASFITWCKRIYYAWPNVSQENLYVPKALFHALGVDYDDFTDKINDFRSWINSYIVRASAYAVPANMSIYSRHTWMISGLYTDNPTMQSQMYVFNPIGFWEFGLNSETGAGCLKWKKMPYWNEGDIPAPEGSVYKSLATFKDIKSYGESILLAFSNNEDASTISGDMLKWVGSENTLKFSLAQENIMLVPTYDEVVLTQINNITLMGEPTWSDGFIGLDQNPNIGSGALDSILEFNVGGPDAVLRTANVSAKPPGMSFLTDSRLVNSPVENPSPELIVEMTRLTCIASEPEYVPEGKTWKYECITGNTEIVSFASITTNFDDWDYVYSSSKGTTETLFKYKIGSRRYHCVNIPREMISLNFTPLTTPTNEPAVWNEFINAIANYSAFDWAPINAFVPMLWDTDDNGVVKSYIHTDIQLPIGDYAVTAVFTSHNLRAINHAVLLSLYNVVPPAETKSAPNVDINPNK